LVLASGRVFAVVGNSTSVPGCACLTVAFRAFISAANSELRMERTGCVRFLVDLNFASGMVEAMWFMSAE
jgi:hypothetical protein